MGDVPEQVYLDAAKASDDVLFSHRPISSDATLSQSKHPGFRAAVASAYRAGQAAGLDGVRCDCHGSLFIVGVGEPRWHVFDGNTITTFEEFAKVAEGRAATPDGPRRWASQVPAEPGPDVLAVQIVETGQRWERRYAKDQPDRWAWGHWLLEWSQLLSWAAGRTLTDATPAADGQDGDGRG